MRDLERDGFFFSGRRKPDFQRETSDEQLRLAQATRVAIEKEFGSYQNHREATLNPDRASVDVGARARRLGTLTLPLQWVKGNAEKAEASFIRINRQAANITPQELELIESRKEPPVIVARAIIQRATCHQYWSSFTRAQQNQIKDLAVSIHELIFHPPLSHPIKSLDLSCGGAVCSSTVLRMIYDLVQLCCKSPASGSTAVVTIALLKDVKRAAQLMCSNAPSSVGLHPAMYFYSWTGRQHPILFLTWADTLLEHEEKKMLDKFIAVRGGLETFLVGNRPIMNQVIRKYGTKESGKKYVKQILYDIVALLQGGTKPGQITVKSKENAAYSYLQPEESPYTGVVPTRFSTQVKSGLVVQELLENAQRCPICNGFVPAQAISIDHWKRVIDGGKSTASNAQITHPYCNTGFKER